MARGTTHTGTDIINGSKLTRTEMRAVETVLKFRTGSGGADMPLQAERTRAGREEWRRCTGTGTVNHMHRRNTAWFAGP
jgi:hypothetical protein